MSEAVGCRGPGRRRGWWVAAAAGRRRCGGAWREPRVPGVGRGGGIVIMPMAPAASRVFQRSWHAGVGAEGALEFGGCAVVEDGDFSVEVEAGEVVDVVRGEAEAVADEDEGSVDGGAGDDVGAEGDVFA